MPQRKRTYELPSRLKLLSKTASGADVIQSVQERTAVVPGLLLLDVPAPHSEQQF